MNGLKQKVLLEKCPDKRATVTFTLKTTLVSATMGSETTSIVSDMISVDSGPESEYNFGDLVGEESKEGDRKSGIDKVNVASNIDARQKRRV